MSWRMEVLSPASNLSNLSWVDEGSNFTKWTPTENKLFENALAMFDKDTPDRWHKVAAMVPGKTVLDVFRQYKELEDDVNSIEAGLIPVPGYSTSPFALEWENNPGYEGFKQVCGNHGKRSLSTRTSEQERKKGVPWTEEEHKLFLMGLKKYGKGDWRNISRNYVITRTPTQVASHAQKYFIRQLSGGKDKRRASIHDITTVNFNDIPSETTDDRRNPSPEQPSMLIQRQNSTAVHGIFYQWNQPNNGAAVAFNQTCGGMLMSSPYVSYELKEMDQNSQRSASCIGAQNLDFQAQATTQHYPHG